MSKRINFPHFRHILKPYLHGASETHYFHLKLSHSLLIKTPISRTDELPISVQLLIAISRWLYSTLQT